jgi:hypothetical protein
MFQVTLVPAAPFHPELPPLPFLRRTAGYLTEPVKR